MIIVLKFIGGAKECSIGAWRGSKDGISKAENKRGIWYIF